MNLIKNKEEIKAIREGGKILASILDKLSALVKPGVNTADLEALMLDLVDQAGGRPAFKDYPMGGGILFPSAICASINDEVVHGSAIPGRILKAGDIIDLDIGMEWPIRQDIRDKYNLVTNPHSELGGFYTDMCRTLPVGAISSEAKRLIRVTKECLNIGIKVAKAGATLNDIGTAIQKHAEAAGYGVVRDLVGHGVGYKAHEEPDVYHYAINPNSPDNLVLQEGMVICIEPMINQGSHRVKIADNGYAIITADASLSAHFEHTLAITKNGADILTAK